jgi:hypothetical protein
MNVRKVAAEAPAEMIPPRQPPTTSRKASDDWISTAVSEKDLTPLLRDAPVWTLNLKPGCCRRVHWSSLVGCHGGGDL